MTAPLAFESKYPAASPFMTVKQVSDAGGSVEELLASVVDEGDDDASAAPAADHDPGVKLMVSKNTPISISSRGTHSWSIVVEAADAGSHIAIGFVDAHCSNIPVPEPKPAPAEAPPKVPTCQHDRPGRLFAPQLSMLTVF